MTARKPSKKQATRPRKASVKRSGYLIAKSSRELVILDRTRYVFAILLDCSLSKRYPPDAAAVLNRMIEAAGPKARKRALREYHQLLKASVERKAKGGTYDNTGKVKTATQD